jgi:ketosteroid isomerase-like protein
MAEPKTRPTRASVAAFLGAVPHPERRRDARAVSAMMRAATGTRATMWGPNIIGFGRQPITASTGKATDWPVAAFSPRGTGLVLYFDPAFLAHHPLLPRLGQHKVGKSCLYIRRLEDVHLPTLRKLISTSVRAVRARTACPSLLLAVSCRTQPPAQASATFDLQAACAVVAQKNAAFTAAHVTGDVATIDAMFTRDARALPPGAEPVIGVAALHAFTVEYLRSGVKAFEEQTTDCYGNGDLLVDQGAYVVTYGPDNTVERGKYLNVWVQEDGTWKIRANIWNTSPPAGTAP